MGSCLPSAREVLIIRPTGKKGSTAEALQPEPPSTPGVPARKPSIPKQDPNASGPGGMQWLLLRV
jgi:hypothetical protein